MKAKKRDFSEILDEKDKKIIEILQFNSREKLTKIAKQVNLSIDSVNKRIKKLVASRILFLRALVDPRKIGYHIVSDNKVKLHNITEQELKSFLDYLVAYPRVIEVITIAGDWDVTCIIIAKDSEELESTIMGIRQRFSKLIASWTSVLTLKVYKFEEYKL